MRDARVALRSDALPTEMPPRCAVCGCGEVAIDEVLERGGWMLAACPRCDHRWTRPLPARPRSVRRPHLPSEAADAA